MVSACAGAFEGTTQPPHPSPLSPEGLSTGDLLKHVKNKAISTVKQLDAAVRSPCPLGQQPGSHLQHLSQLRAMSPTLATAHQVIRKGKEQNIWMATKHAPPPMQLLSPMDTGVFEVR